MKPDIAIRRTSNEAPNQYCALCSAKLNPGNPPLAELFLLANDAGNSAPGAEERLIAANGTDLYALRGTNYDSLSQTLAPSVDTHAVERDKAWKMNYQKKPLIQQK